MVPFATSAAKTKALLALKSVAMTSAPLSSFSPSTIAVWLFKIMFAPIRINSLTCIKRFSNSFSSILLAPSATSAKAINCACMSVGKPGYSLVAIFAPFILVAGFIVIEFSFKSKSNPIS